MRISDWSSDVCSSELVSPGCERLDAAPQPVIPSRVAAAYNAMAAAFDTLRLSIADEIGSRASSTKSEAVFWSRPSHSPHNTSPGRASPRALSSNSSDWHASPTSNRKSVVYEKKITERVEFG